MRVVFDDLSAPKQCEIARNFVKDVKIREKNIFINNTVLCETVWVLMKLYKLDKSSIIELIEALLKGKIFVFESHATIEQSLCNYKNGNADLADYLILQLNKNCVTTYTFDKKAAKNNGYTLLQENDS